MSGGMFTCMLLHVCPNQGGQERWQFSGLEQMAESASCVPWLGVTLSLHVKIALSSCTVSPNVRLRWTRAKAIAGWEEPRALDCNVGFCMVWILCGRIAKERAAQLQLFNH